MKLSDSSDLVVLHIQVDLLGELSVVSCTVIDRLFEMMEIEEAVNWFEGWATATIFPEALCSFDIALGFCTVADGLKLEPASPWLAAASVALGLSAIFYGIVVSYLLAGFATGFDYEWARNVCIAVFWAVFVGIFRLEMDDKLTVLGQDIVKRLLVWRGIVLPSNWNPVLSTMSNIFKWSSLAIFLVLVFVFEGLIAGWW